jgi:hypothetical protein
LCLFPVTTPIGLGKKNTISCICSEQSQSNRESRPIHHPLIGWYIGSPKTRLHSRMVILTIKAVWCPRHNHRSSVILGVYIISSPPPHFLVGAHLFEEAYVYIYIYIENPLQPLFLDYIIVLVCLKNCYPQHVMLHRCLPY